MSLALLTRPVPASTGGYRYCSQGQVEPALIATLRQKGFRDPICSLSDPRLDFPELLLLDGFRWQRGDSGSSYLREIEEWADYSQRVEYFPNDVRRVTTQCGKRLQELTLHADGTCIEIIR